MGLKVQDKAVYRHALQQLLPRGSFWDNQLSDLQSDVSLLLAARAEELHSVRERMADLQKESLPLTAIEALSDWERIFLGKNNESMPIDQRRQLMFALQSGNVNSEVIKQTAALYGVRVTEVFFPYRAACFGHARFGIDRIASLAALSVLFVQSENKPEGGSLAGFESTITNMLLANQIVFFFYKKNSGGKQ